jgi:hypothetical protein
MSGQPQACTVVTSLSYLVNRRARLRTAPQYAAAPPFIANLNHYGSRFLVLGSGPDYFSVTARVAEPPWLLRTVICCGFIGQMNWQLYLPPPVF